MEKYQVKNDTANVPSLLEVSEVQVKKALAQHKYSLMTFCALLAKDNLVAIKKNSQSRL
jgi:hypothetical protein